MAKKFFDIIPPHLISDVEDKAKDLMGIKSKKKKSKKGKKEFSRLKVIFSFAGIVIVLFASYLYFALASAKVEIWPKTEAVALDKPITAGVDVLEVDLANNEVPAQLLEEENELFQEFPATGSSSKEGIAGGTIRVYNKANPAKSFTFVAKTRFLSDTGKLFRSVNKVTVPAAEIKGSKVTPGWVDVKVTAVESGEAYNINPSKFSLPGLAGTASFYNIYGETTEKMTGGYESALKIVTAEDIEDAKNSLTQKLLSDTEDILKGKISSESLVMFNDSFAKDVLESSSSVKAGAEVEKFTYKAKVKVSALVIKEADLKDIAVKYILDQYSGEKTILQKSFVLNYGSETVDLKTKEIELNLNIVTEVFPTIDEQAMTLAFMGKKVSEITNVINGEFPEQINSVVVDFWPFWVKKAPNDQEKIKIELKFE
ncbi:MAG: hypothetical protein WC845_03355 [Candidatus Staskawiczbacteria bacterium]|jgi:hypothetical protein